MPAIGSSALPSQRATALAAYRHLADLAGLHLLVAEPHSGTLVDANRSALRLLGYSRRALLGQPLATLLAEVPARLGPGRRPFRQQLRTGPGPMVRVHGQIGLRSSKAGDWLVLVFREQHTETTSPSAQTGLLDGLTGLPNRQASQHHLRQRLQRQAFGTSLGVLVVDLDNFWAINDSFGPGSGDRMLLALADKLRRRHPHDWLARIGTGSFLLLLDGQSSCLGDTLATAQALRLALEQDLAAEPHLPVRPGLSVAVSSYPEHANQADDLLRCADLALMEARSHGHGQVCVYSQRLSERVRTRLDLNDQLARAIDRDQLRLVLQPQRDRDGQLVGAEVLLRWRDSHGHDVPPALFVPLAEQSGQILTLSSWVQNETCRLISCWRRAGLSVPRVALNVSGREFDSGPEPFSDRLLSRLAAHELQADQLELELTETALLANPQQARWQLQQLADQGVTIAIDDFGTGQSSLAQLQHLPAHSLKIDIGFVSRLSPRLSDQAIVRAIITMAHDLELSTTAEGVEQAIQHRILHGLGCDRYQGFLISCPLEVPAFEALLSPGHRGLI